MKHKVRIFVGIVLAAFGLSGQAMADGYPLQSLGYYGPYNWSGLYVGGHAGWMGANVKGNYALPPVTDRYDVDYSTAIGGGHIGFQHQFGNVVLGVEAAGNWGGNDRASTPSATPSCLASTANRLCTANLNEVLTVGPRLGVAFDRWMVFGTGGFARGQVKTRTLDTTTLAATSDTKKDQQGWFAGGGVEYALSNNLLFGVEYQHVALDGARHFDAAFALNGNTRDISADADIVRARLTFKLGREPDYRPPLK